MFADEKMLQSLAGDKINHTQGHLPGAVNLPLSDLESHLEELGLAQ